jgi:hypothetical protein
MDEKLPHFAIGKSAKFGARKRCEDGVALQKQFAREISRKTCNVFAAALGVRARPRAALI